MEILSALAQILTILAFLIIFPLGATIIGAVFIFVYIWTKVKFALVTGVLWIVYSIYEYLMYARILCSGECNIRVDLLLIYPVLILVSVITAVLVLLKKRKIRKQRNMA